MLSRRIGHIKAVRLRQERAPAGGQYDRAGPALPPDTGTLAGHPGRPGHRAVRADQQFQGRMVVEDRHAAAVHPPPHPTQVFGALSASTTRAPEQAAAIAAQVPAGPPPSTRTSASNSSVMR
jgi:hypothetical protein